MSAATINLIVNCSQSKRRRELPPISFSRVTAKKLDSRLKQWTRLVDRCEERIPAGELYVGQYWDVVRDVVAQTSSLSRKIRVQIASAGFGVLRMEDPIPNYSATFQSGVADSVLVGDEINGSRRGLLKDWWQKLNQQFGSEGATKTMVTEIGKHDLVIVVLSPDYLAAIEDDLVAIKQRLARPDRLMLFSTNLRYRGSLQSNMIELDVTLQGHLGGSRTSLSIRMVRQMLAQCEKLDRCDVAYARRVFKKMRNQHGKHVVFDRTPTTDKEVLKFIRVCIKNGSTHYTPVLRNFRDQGNACEMKRFRKLFEQAVKNHA